MEAGFYEEPQLYSMLRVVFVVKIIKSFAVVQHTIYTTSIDIEIKYMVFVWVIIRFISMLMARGILDMV